MVEMEEMLACIISLDNSDITYLNRKISNLVNDIKQFVSKKLDIELTASAGSVHKEIKGIYRSYREALDALETQMYLGEGHFILYDDIIGRNRNYHFSISVEHRLINIIENRRL